jgi:hypothetical protein
VLPLAVAALLRDALFRRVEDPLVQVVPFGRGDVEVDAQAIKGDDHVVQDVVRVTDPGDVEPAQAGNGKVGGGFGKGFHHGQKIC